METVAISLPKSRTGQWLRWSVQVGDQVEAKQVLGYYHHTGSSGAVRKYKLLSNMDGEVDTLLAQEGQQIQPDQAVLSVSRCTHGVVFDGFCVACGKDVKKTPFSDARDDDMTAMVMGGNQRVLHFKPQAFSAVREESVSWFLQHRKLALVLDIDHTLLHATHDPRVERYFSSPVLRKDLYQLPPLGPGPPNCVKLRPWLRDFLEGLKDLYEMHIYTMGNRAYAEAVAKVLDPDHRYFKQRIVSRDDCPDINFKNLQRLFPVDEAMVILFSFWFNVSLVLTSVAVLGGHR